MPAGKPGKREWSASMKILVGAVAIAVLAVLAAVSVSLGMRRSTSTEIEVTEDPDDTEPSTSDPATAGATASKPNGPAQVTEPMQPGGSVPASMITFSPDITRVATGDVPSGSQSSVLIVPARVTSYENNCFASSQFSHIIFKSADVGGIETPQRVLGSTVKTVRLPQQHKTFNLSGATGLQRLTVNRESGTMLISPPPNFGLPQEYSSPNIAPMGLYIKTSKGVLYEDMQGKMVRFVTTDGRAMDYDGTVLEGNMTGIICVPAIPGFRFPNGYRDSLAAFTTCLDIDFSMSTDFTNLSGLGLPRVIQNPNPTALILPPNVKGIHGDTFNWSTVQHATCVMPASLSALTIPNGTRYVYGEGTGYMRVEMHVTKEPIIIDGGDRTLKFSDSDGVKAVEKIISKHPVTFVSLKSMPAWLRAEHPNPSFPLVLPAGMYEDGAVPTPQ